MILRLVHPQDERERMEYRYEASRALAELEDLHRSLNGHMAERCKSEIVLMPLKRK